MKKLGLLLTLVSLFGFSQNLEYSDPDSQGISKDRIERISELSKSYVDNNKVANVTTIVNRNGNIIYYKAFGQRGADDKRKIKKDDLYRIYSMTKPIVSVAIMQLYEKGLFHLNDPIENFLPEFKNLKIAINKDSLVEAKNKITFKHLLTHTSGLSYGWSAHPSDFYFREAEVWTSKSLDEFTKKIANIPLRFEPGTKYYYSVSTDILGALIEKISGMSLTKYLSKNIFEPLGMNDTFFEVPRNKQDRFLPNHIYNRNKNQLETIQNDSFRITDFDSGGGGLISTAYDYMIFAESLRNGGEFKGK